MVLMKDKHEGAKMMPKMMPPICEVALHHREEMCRKAAFHFLAWYYTQVHDASLLVHLLHGLEDTSEEIQDEMFLFWEELMPKNSPFSRLL